MIIASFIMSIILFIRIFLLDKKYGKIEIITRYDGNISSCDPKIGHQISIMKFDLSVIKSNIFNVKFDGIDKSQITLKSLYNHEIKNGQVFTITIQGSEKITINVTYSDELDNEYFQKIEVIPAYYDEKITNGWISKISNRIWNILKIYKKFIY